MSNRLKDQSSPYLLQHAENPVDWYPWGDEAFEKALGEDKPVFLSIGYSTCHWCHVMAHEYLHDSRPEAFFRRHLFSGQGTIRHRRVFGSAACHCPAVEERQYPMGYSLFLTAWLLYENPPQEITVVLSKEDSPEEILARLPLCSNVKIYVDNVENARITESVNCVKSVDNFSGSRGKASPRISEKISPDREMPDSSTFERLPPCPDGYTLLNGKTTYYVCKNHTCYPPSNQIPG